tara:strand:+ start:189 stop:656 length:468 start_codon:yes stop_codon:yes gene_type:complete
MSPNSVQGNVTGRTLIAVSSLVIIAINSYILNYLLNLEKSECECSDNWQRNYIKYYSVVAITVSSILLVLMALGLRLPRALNNLLSVVSYLLKFFTLINIFVLYNYSRNLVLKNCNCSENTARTFMKYYSMLIIGILVLAIFISILMGVVIRASA